MRLIYRVFYSVAMALLLLASCTSKEENRGPNFNSQQEEDDFASIAEFVGDSVSGEKVSKECAVVCYKIDSETESAESVKSPDALISLKKKHAANMSEANSNASTLDQRDRALVQEHAAKAEEAYKNACRQYELPASGVIANLQNLIQSIDKVQTRKDFDNFRDCRIGMLEDLDNIHLCVESRNTSGVSEVRKLAQTLKGKYIAMKEKFDK